MPFPIFMYRSPGAHQCKGGTFEYTVCNDITDYNRLISNGWYGWPEDSVTRTFTLVPKIEPPKVEKVKPNGNKKKSDKSSV